MNRPEGFRPSLETETKKPARLLESRSENRTGTVEVTRFEYDDQGRVAAKRTRQERSRTFVQDELFTYDDQGRVATQTSRHEHSDEKGRIRILGITKEYLYDEHGNVTMFSLVPTKGERQKEQERLEDGQVRVSETTYEYNDRRQVIRQVTTDSGGRTTEKRMQYNTENELQELIVTTSNTGGPEDATRYRYTYDTQGRLTTVFRGHPGATEDYGQIDYTYSKDGRKKTQTNTYGNEIVWVISEQSDEQGNVVEYQFTSNLAGSPDKKTENKVKTTHTYG